MTKIEFQEEFIDFLKAKGVKIGKKAISFEWEVFEGFQKDICRQVGFDEYLEIIGDDWLQTIRKIKENLE